MRGPDGSAGRLGHDVEASHFAAIIAGSSDAILSHTLDSVVQSWNPAAERLFGYTQQEMIGESIRILIPEDRQAEEDGFLASISSGDAVSSFRTIRRRKDGGLVPVAVTVSPIRDGADQIVGGSKMIRDLSVTQAAGELLRESEERLGDVADNISQLAWMAKPDGHIFWYNRRWYDYTGTSLDDVEGWGWQSVHHPDHVERVTECIQRSWDTGEPWEDTFPLRGRDGTYRWFLSRALPIRNAAGEIVRWFGTNTDITEQREQQDHIQLLMLEVNHRAKNTLSLVQAIARQAAVNEAERDFVERFTTRLVALAANQDVLVRSGWQGGYPDDLVRTQLSHFADLLGSRVHIDGPSVRLTTSAVQVLGMALHELATNAGKYGALSGDAGEVRISWSHDHGAGRFQMEWTETGGPVVRQPSRTGFGSTVLNKFARSGLDADVSVDFLPEGVSWRLSCPAPSALWERDVG